MSSKIFEEAIADAKKLREVAEDNAKKAIEASKKKKEKNSELDDAINNQKKFINRE